MQDTLTITVDGQPRDIFMSFGLLHELLRAVGDISGASVIAIDPEIREKVMLVTLSERDEEGRVSKPFPFYRAKITPADMQRLFQWVAEHVLDFFLTAMEKAVEVHQPHEGRLRRTET